MRFQNVAVASVACELPPVEVTSAALEERLAPLYERLKLPQGRLELMTGIRARRFWEPGTRSSQASARAGAKALAQAGVEAAEIGCLVHASVCRDFLEPATASVVHHQLGLPQTATIFDLSNACLGVLNGMVQVANMIECGQIDAGLIVSGETAEGLHEATIHHLLDDRDLTRAEFKKHFASLTIGSGAAGVVLVRADRAGEAHRLLGGAVRTDSAANALCQEDTQAPQSARGPLMATDSEALLHAGIALAAATWRALAAELAWEAQPPQHVFTHQVGIAHKRLLFEAVALDPALDTPTVQDLGNTGSAALPTAFALGPERRDMQPGDTVALLGIGSGLSSLMLGVEW